PPRPGAYPLSLHDALPIWRRAEGRRRTAVGRDAIRAIERVPDLELDEPLCLQEAELRAADVELVRNLPRDRALTQQHETVVLADCGGRTPTGDCDEVGLASGRNRQQRRKLERCAA